MRFEKKDQVEFAITIESPIGITVAAAKDIYTNLRPRWRVAGIALKKIKPNVFECQVGIAMEDAVDNDIDSLMEFRDQFLSLLSFTAMAPVRPLSKGRFTFPLGGNNFRALSLGFTEKTYPPTGVITFTPLVEGLGLKDAHKMAVRFVWAALNSEEPLYRFINLAIAYEMLIGADSLVNRSKCPSCASCGTKTQECPKCRKRIRIPSSLSERGAFLFPSDDDLLSKFVEFRNRIFHGGLPPSGETKVRQLRDANDRLLVNVRNYLGKFLKLDPIRRADLMIALNPPDVAMWVDYSVPPSTESPLSPDQPKT